jgi:hypothetical protein
MQIMEYGDIIYLIPVSDPSAPAHTYYSRRFQGTC